MLNTHVQDNAIDTEEEIEANKTILMAGIKKMIANKNAGNPTNYNKALKLLREDNDNLFS